MLSHHLAAPAAGALRTSPVLTVAQHARGSPLHGLYARKHVVKSVRGWPRSSLSKGVQMSAAGSFERDSSRLKEKILSLASATDRGVSTPSDVASGLASCIAELEAINPNPEVNRLLDGDWVLVWSNNIAPERVNSPLFMAVRSFTDTLTQTGASNLIFQLTDVMKSGVGMGYGDIVQSISLASGEIVSKVDLVASPAFGIKLTGTVTTTAKATATETDDTIKIQVVNTRIVGSALPGMDQVVFPYQPVFEQLLNAHKTVRGDSGAQLPDVVTLRTTYIDQDMRIGRVEGDISVYLRRDDTNEM